MRNTVHGHCTHTRMTFKHWLHLSEQGAIESHSEETVHGPHGNVQVHQQPLLLQSVDCGTDPLVTQVSQISSFIINSTQFNSALFTQCKVSTIVT